MDTTRLEYFFLCPDTADLLAAGSDLLELVRTYRSRVIRVHHKDVDFSWYNDDGEGVVDFLL